MQRQLPGPAPLARARRLLAALPSGLPTSSACVLAAALVVTPVVTLQAVIPPSGHRDGGTSSQILGRAASRRQAPHPPGVPECAAGGGQCAVPNEPTGRHPKAATDGASNQPGAAVAAPTPTAPAVVAHRDSSADEETGPGGWPNDPDGASADREHAGDRDSADRDAGGHDGDSDRDSREGE